MRTRNQVRAKKLDYSEDRRRHQDDGGDPPASRGYRKLRMVRQSARDLRGRDTGAAGRYRTMRIMKLRVRIEGVLAVCRGQHWLRCALMGPLRGNAWIFTTKLLGAFDHGDHPRQLRHHVGISARMASSRRQAPAKPRARI
jgi:hypothetical protein